MRATKLREAKSKTLRLVADFTYDANIMHGDDIESKNWFYKEILQGNNLILNDIGDIGDCIGGITILEIRELEAKQKAGKQE